MSAPAPSNPATANIPLSGAREGRLTWARRLLARAAGSELAALVVPGPEVARAAGFDVEAAGLSLAAGPRQASVLVLLGHSVGLSQGLERAAEVAYAQTPRPRAVLVVGDEVPASLPVDARCEPDQEALAAAVSELRRAFREGAFSRSVEDFEGPALETKTIYTCSMHPEVEQEEPGQCPKCGMELIPKESAGDPESQHDHGGPEEHGQTADEHTSDGHTGHETEAGEEGSDPVEQENGERAGEANGGPEEHGSHEGHGDHEEMDFMSMVEMTQGTPRSSDGLQMEWVEAPFGPVLPGLPGGLSLSFTLDGDTVAETGVGSVAGGGEALLRGTATGLPARAGNLDPLSPLAYRMLVSLALEEASNVSLPEEERLYRLAAVEVERAASHAGWLSSFAYLLGMEPARRTAARLELRLRRLCGASEGGELRQDHISADVLEAAARLSARIDRAPLLRRRLRGIGVLETQNTEMGGPLARAAGRSEDLRLESADYETLGFEPMLEEGSDALARLRLRLAELRDSLELAREALRRAGRPEGSAGDAAAAGSGAGAASIETPRGPATLWLAVEGGEVVEAQLIAPSQSALALVENVAVRRELGDALVGVASLDISPWGLG